MYFYGNIEVLNREQHKDRLRRIEHNRLVREVEVTNTVPGFWMGVYRAVKNGINGIQLVTKSVRLPERIEPPPAGVNRG
jgi:hypothetical protein